ncbi:MAG: MerR family transcriptional regulator [Ruminococcaceae bacterium]|nr:MerR family transcriptional regulator [Oscillospiraceae bacterium]
MNQRKFHDITEVCKTLGTTSRTLRFYEEKGIITSTTVGTSARRQYTEEQVSHIRNVLVLRTLGLSVKAIKDLQAEKLDLREAVLSKRAEIYASIDSRVRKINLLNEALVALECNKNIFSENWQSPLTTTPKEFEIAKLCTDAILNDNSELLYKHLSPTLTTYMPKAVYIVVRKDTLAPLGDFICIDEITSDKHYPNKIISKIKFLNLGLKITFVFHRGMIDGLWLGYYNTNER